jgi:AcrR family transcriptional regulator
MSRTTDYKIKEDILERVIFSISYKGLNNLSLRDIAREVGMSARMLIYHFESYDNLINSIFIYLSTKHKNMIKNLLTENSDKTLGEVTQIFIETIYIDENKKYLLLFLELYVKALRDVEKYSDFFNEVLHNWIDEIETIISRKYGVKSKSYASMILSFYRGLMLEWLASNDDKRIIESSRLFSIIINNLMVKVPDSK